MRLIPRTLAATAALCAAGLSQAQGGVPIKVGLMLPYTGTYAALGNMIENGFKLYVQEQGGKLGGREIQYFKVDDESDPSKATDNANKLIKRDQVDVLVGTVHSGVALAMARAAKESNTLLIIPNAGAGDITGPMCSPNIVRSSFSNWQPGYAMGVVAGERGVKRAMTITWNYAAGAETVKGFTEVFEKGGGKVMKDLTLPFPNVEFQALLTEIAAQKPDAVYAFFAGGGAVKFVKDYAAAGLKQTIPLVWPGLPDRRHARGAGRRCAGPAHHAALRRQPRSAAQQRVSQELRARLQDATPTCMRCRATTLRRSCRRGLRPPKGDMKNREAITSAMRKVVVDSPRGKFTHLARRRSGAGLLPPRSEGQEQRVQVGRGEGPGRPGARLQAVELRLFRRAV